LCWSGISFHVGHAVCANVSSEAVLCVSKERPQTHSGMKGFANGSSAGQPPRFVLFPFNSTWKINSRPKDPVFGELASKAHYSNSGAEIS